ncbi:type IVB secretion system protein IcmJDotN [Piscirickettsia litoralis]|uniref:Uncharacterized protein n=1 Tax=Piscirickettsia litoralis TaxID=1891921 RepID=A0ABX3ACF2_9GAMM|nr:type IVB secretion system protein IcmJDotN [Piscirickettsia litoralis]ODN43844.1 hypothetical protein BGC07_14295 [Piscirickettsia litoralis]
MINLNLQAIPGNIIKFKRRKTNKTFQQLTEKIASQAQYHCQYCGLSCESFFDIVNIDGNYSNNVESNFALACQLCSPCLLMDQYDISYNGHDRLIYLPEITQAHLNLMVAAMAKLSVSEENKEHIISAKTLYSSLKDRVQFLKEVCQSDLSHPGTFLFINNGENKNYELISGVRLLFPLNRVAEIIL